MHDRQPTSGELAHPEMAYHDANGRPLMGPCEASARGCYFASKAGGSKHDGPHAFERWRRHWERGRCDDCGRDRSTTVIEFWASGYRYRVCSDCIKPYRGSITTRHDRLTK